MNHSPTVRVGELYIGSYRERMSEDSTSEKMDFPFIGEIKVCGMISTPSPKNIIQKNWLLKFRFEKAENELGMLKPKKARKDRK